MFVSGDSRFSLRPYMMTPILNAVPGSQESKYTKLHCKARNCIEHCFGLLKARWRCLLNHHPLHYTPQVTLQIINACAVLHNIAIVAKLPEPPHLQLIEDDYAKASAADLEDDHDFDDIDEIQLQQGQLTQRGIVENL